MSCQFNFGRIFPKGTIDNDFYYAILDHDWKLPYYSNFAKLDKRSMILHHFLSQLISSAAVLHVLS